MKVENSGFCPNCGAENAPAPADKKARRASNGGKGKWLVIALALVVIVGAAFAVAVYNGPQAVAERYCELLWTDPGSALKLYAADTDRAIDADFEYETLETVLEDYDVLLGIPMDAGTPEEYFQELKIMRRELIEQLYADYSITTATRMVKDISVKKLKTQENSLIRALESKQLLDSDEITDAKIIDVKLTIKGEDDTRAYYYTVYTVKLNGAWRVIDLANGNVLEALGVDKSRGNDFDSTPVYNAWFGTVMYSVLINSDALGEAKAPVSRASADVTEIQEEIEKYFKEVEKGNKELNLTEDNAQWVKSLYALMGNLKSLTAVYQAAVESADPVSFLSFVAPDYDPYSVANDISDSFITNFFYVYFFEGAVNNSTDMEFAVAFNNSLEDTY